MGSECARLVRSVGSVIRFSHAWTFLFTIAVCFLWKLYDRYGLSGQSSGFRVPGPFCLLLLFVSCGSCMTGTVRRVSRQVFACLDLFVYYCCLFAVEVVRLVRLVVPVGMVTASLALLWDSLMFCMNRVLLILLDALFADLVIVLTSVGIFWMCVLMRSNTVAIRMAMVIIVWRVCDVCWLFGYVVSCRPDIVCMSVSAMSHPSSGILLAGTAFLPSLIFPICSSLYS